MKQLTCEMCGSIDLLKQDGMFVCQTCGCKYSVEEAKKMMVEGVVEVSGTVKIDNSAKIENMLANAKRAYKDGRYQQAQELCSQILNEEPNNAEAICYEEFSIFRQGDFKNHKNYAMDKVASAVKRALEIAFKKSGKTDDFGVFMCDALEQIRVLEVEVVSLYCTGREQEKYDNRKKRLDVERRLRIVKDWTVREKLFIANMSLEGRYSRIDFDFDVVIEKTFWDILSVWETAIDMVIELNQDALINALKSSLWLVTSDLSPSLFMHKECQDRYEEIQGQVTDMEMKIDNYYVEKKRKKIEEYWNEHPAEKEALDQEKSSLESEQKDLNNILASNNDRKMDFERERDKIVPAQQEIDLLEEKKTELSSRKSKLGLFKRKEREEIDNQIAEISCQMDVLRPAVEIQRQAQETEYDKKIEDIKQQLCLDEKKLKEIEKRLSEVNEELTKER